MKFATLTENERYCHKNQRDTPSYGVGNLGIDQAVPEKDSPLLTR